MQRVFLISVAASVLALAGCATTTPPPAGMQPGKFVAFDCEGQDFQARFNAEGNTVRVRTHHGAAELSAAGEGVFQGEGFKLAIVTPLPPWVEHAGKVLGKNCKRV
jgi:hypothetical protein